jgi:hypothetical protein
MVCASPTYKTLFHVHDHGSQGQYYRVTASYYVGRLEISADIADNTTWGWYRGGSHGTNVTLSNAWHHIAFVRNNDVLSTYLDGTRLSSDAVTLGNIGSSPTPAADMTFDFGGDGFSPYASLGALRYSPLENAPSDFGWAGTMDEVHISSDISNYTGTSYQVPQAPFSDSNSDLLLLHLNNSLTDNSILSQAVNFLDFGTSSGFTSSSKFGSGAIHFTGQTGDYNYVDSNGNSYTNPMNYPFLELANFPKTLPAQFVIEFWIKPDNTWSPSCN